jgi:flavin-dependent dehydrogenase
MGYRVGLIVPGIQPNRPDLQSVSPGVLTLVSAIGLNTQMIRQSLTPIQCARKCWDGIEEEHLHPPGFLVYRHIFDNALLTAAKQLGVSEIRSASLTGWSFVNEKWELQVSQGGTSSKLIAKFLVDATGKKSVFRGKKIRVSTQTLAITGLWKNTSCPSASTQLESTATHWLWGSKLSGDLFHVTVFTDPSSISGKSRLTEEYVKAIKETILFRSCLRGALTSVLAVVDVTPYYYENPVGRNFIKVGEAVLGMDPQSSQGVQSVMANAIQGAIAVNSVLTHPFRLNMVRDFYSSRLQESMQNHLAMISKNYALATCWQHEPFWKNRTIYPNDLRPFLKTEPGTWDQTTLIKASDAITLKLVGCIEGDFITQKLALVHPGIPNPMVYWQNIEIAKVIETLNGGQTVAGLMNSWSRVMPPASALELLHILKGAGVLHAAI